jgi:hypothetical protein
MVNGFTINGEAAIDYSGSSVSDTGDVNGDGFADLLIGTSRSDPNGGYSGASFVVFGKGDAFSPTLELRSLGGAIRGDGSIRAIKITGDLAASALNAAIITARGTLAPASSAQALAIGSIKIGGSGEHAEILAGYDRAGPPVNADAGIGRVLVGRNWIASNLIAGATAGIDGLFGTDNDAPISRDSSLVARIASILIKGTAMGTADGSDHFGFVAEEIGAFKTGTAKLTLTRGPNNDLTAQPVGSTGDLTIREVA